MPMQATRQQILDHLRAEGSATVRELVRVLGLTATGVRQHLTVLEQEHLVQHEEVRGRVGRPALRYRLSQAGDHIYPKRYEQLANALLDEVRTTYGAEGLQRVVRGAAGRLARGLPQPADPRPADGCTPAGPGQRVESVVRMLRAADIVCDWEQDGSAFLLHERTCPYPEVARTNSVVCAMDVALVRELSGMDARLTECLVRGDHACTYRLVPLGTVRR